MTNPDHMTAKEARQLTNQIQQTDNTNTIIKLIKDAIQQQKTSININTTILTKTTEHHLKELGYTIDYNHTIETPNNQNDWGKQKHTPTAAITWGA